MKNVCKHGLISTLLREYCISFIAWNKGWDPFSIELRIRLINKSMVSHTNAVLGKYKAPYEILSKYYNIVRTGVSITANFV